MDPKELKFAKSHEWIEAEGASRKVGISDFAQEQLGDIVFVEFPDEPKDVAAGDEVCIVESCKATSSVYAPVAGRIVEYNSGLADTPEKINESPFDEAWLFKIEPTDDEAGGTATLMSFDDYTKQCEQE